MIKGWKPLGLWTLALAVCTLLSGCGAAGRPSSDAGLFSWKDDALQQQEQLFGLMEEQRLNVLYQHFSGDAEQQSIAAFLQQAAEQDIAVYYLTGDPLWALQEDADSLCSELERVLELNQSQGGQGLKGVVFDVEPYLLDEWEEDRAQDVMDAFVKCMKTAYERAATLGLEVVLCIPYFFDTKGFEAELETLIGYCCDQVAVMNYYREKEIEHIETEAALARAYDKGLITIYELKPPGSHDLTERNTYYQEGLQAVADNFAQMKSAFPEQELSMALHDYKALEEVAGRA